MLFFFPTCLRPPPPLPTVKFITENSGCFLAVDEIHSCLWNQNVCKFRLKETTHVWKNTTCMKQHRNNRCIKKRLFRIFKFPSWFYFKKINKNCGVILTQSAWFQLQYRCYIVTSKPCSVKFVLMKLVMLNTSHTIFYTFL